MKFNGKMITLGRESRSMSQDKLAEAIGEPQVTISALENNKRYDYDILVKIANVLNYPITFFEFESSVNRLSKFYYRKRDSFPSKSIASLEAQMDILRKSFLRLTKQVKLNYKGLPELSVTKDRSPAKIAENIRLYFNLDDNPIDNPINVIEKMGIPVIYFDVQSDKFSGMTIQSDNNIPIIILNKNMPNDHNKYTLFHELGHLIMHVPFTDEIDFYEKYEKHETIEKEADLFAAAFLMPATKAKATFGRVNYARLSELKLYWKVSKQAILYRAKDLGIIDENKFKYIYIELSRNGERKKENITIPIDEPVIMKKIIDIHKTSLGYDYDVIHNEIAGLCRNDFVSWFNLEEKPLFEIVRNIKPLDKASG